MRDTGSEVIDYESLRAGFSWDHAAQRLDGLPSGGTNIAHEAVDRHVLDGHGDRVALRWVPKKGPVEEITYGQLAEQTNRFANALESLGGSDVRLASLAGRVPGLYVGALGTLKAGGVFAPLFAAFGPDPIRQRIEIGQINVLLTTAGLYRRKIAPIRDTLPGLQHVILIDGGSDVDGSRTHDFGAIIDDASPRFTIAPTDPESLALLHFTSGTTGTPKGAMHVHAAVTAHLVTGACALDLHPDDVYWCTADPGWVTGTTYGIISPLCNGVTSIVDEGVFDADRWYALVEEQRVAVWYTAPTAVRMLMRAGSEVAAARDLSSLRLVASVGEPLNPEAVRWAQQTFGRPVLDNWWQSETGCIMIANLVSQEVKPGSMGRPLPGVDAAIAERDERGVITGADGQPCLVADPGTTGELVLRSGWPSMFRGYLGQADRYQHSFVGDWYCSGDLAFRDADGYYWFVGRSDDVIKSAGHLVGPFEVESALIEHPAVIEAGVIGKPDEIAGEIIKAYISLADGFAEDVDLMRDIMAHARRHLGPAVAPREIEVVDRLPRTRSGKIMRRLLKARELGLPLGDTSTLED